MVEFVDDNFHTDKKALGFLVDMDAFGVIHGMTMVNGNNDVLLDMNKSQYDAFRNLLTHMYGEQLRRAVYQYRVDKDVQS